MDEYDSYPALQICGAFGSITIRGSVVDVARTLRDMRDSNDPVIKGALAAVEKNVNDLASGKVGGGSDTKSEVQFKPAGSGYSGSKYAKREHPEGKKCSHGAVVVEQYSGKDDKGYWVCGETKSYNPNKGCSFNDESNISKP